MTLPIRYTVKKAADMQKQKLIIKVIEYTSKNTMLLARWNQILDFHYTIGCCMSLCYFVEADILDSCTQLSTVWWASDTNLKKERLIIFLKLK